MDYLLGILAAIQAIGETEPMVAIVVCVSLVLIALIAGTIHFAFEMYRCALGQKNTKEEKIVQKATKKTANSGGSRFFCCF